MATRVTELSNVITASLDAETPRGMLRLLRQTDSQVFKGWSTFPGIEDNEVLSVMQNVADVAANIITV
jgi:hypothetical protein